MGFERLSSKPQPQELITDALGTTRVYHLSYDQTGAAGLGNLGWNFSTLPSFLSSLTL